LGKENREPRCEPHTSPLKLKVLLAL
jgi:hypothetical protein